ncbi:MAG: DciA family protein [Candidatus Kapaibacterium sp.]
MQGKPTPLNQILKSILHERGWSEKFAEADVHKIWHEIVGDNLANSVKIDRLDDGVLYVITRSSTWRTELLLRKEKLLEEINARLHNRIIKDIVIR